MSLFPATSQEMVLSLINQQNTLPTPLTEENLYFGAAHLDTDGVTSILPTTAQLGGEYEGYATFRYTRINLSTAFDVIPQISDVGGPTLYSMLNIVNSRLGLNLTEDDVLDTNISYIGAGSRVNVSVAAAPGSLGYTGSFAFLFLRQYINFPGAIPNTRLNTLNWLSDPTTEKHDVSMMMYDTDFSLNTASIAVRNNTWVSQPAVAALMEQQFGITDWPAPQVNGVTDYATSNYPGANTNFQRVVVQTGVVDSTYQGTAMFHYNPS